MNYSELLEAIGYIHKNAQRRAVQAVNTSMTIQNWLVGYYCFVNFGLTGDK